MSILAILSTYQDYVVTMEGDLGQNSEMDRTLGKPGRTPG